MYVQVTFKVRPPKTYYFIKVDIYLHMCQEKLLVPFILSGSYNFRSVFQEVVDFKFEQLAHTRNKKSASSTLPNNLSSSRLNGSGGGVESDSSNAEGPESCPPFTVLKKAEVELLVGGKPVTYAVVIKVLPTDDKVRQSSNVYFFDSIIKDIKKSILS